jgi:hypothetical protein
MKKHDFRMMAGTAIIKKNLRVKIVRVFQHFFMVGVINSFLIYKETVNNPLSLKLYIRDVICSWLRVNADIGVIAQDLQTYGIHRRSSKKLKADATRLIGPHTPSIVENKANKRFCIVCKTITHHFCMQCNIALHIGSSTKRHCWMEFHSENWGCLPNENAVINDSESDEDL